MVKNAKKHIETFAIFAPSRFCVGFSLLSDKCVFSGEFMTFWLQIPKTSGFNNILDTGGRLILAY